MKSDFAAFVIVVACSTFLCLGCGGVKKPEGFPDLVGHSVIVKNNGAPEEGVTLSLIPQGVSGSWAVGGVSDAMGKVELVTSQGAYLLKGCPEGKYKVTLQKTVRPSFEKSEEEYLKLSIEERGVYGKQMEDEMKKLSKIIPEQLTSSDKTPLVIDVSSGSKETVVELNDYKK